MLKLDILANPCAEWEIPSVGAKLARQLKYDPMIVAEWYHLGLRTYKAFDKKEIIPRYALLILVHDLWY